MCVVSECVYTNVQETQTNPLLWLVGEYDFHSHHYYLVDKHKVALLLALHLESICLK